MMTYEEFIEQYGDIKVRLSGYHAYVFSFVSDDGMVVSVLKNEKTIYKARYIANKEYTIQELKPVVAYKDGKILGDWG